MTLLAVTALVGTLLTPPVAAEYVALGDSYAAGVGAGGSSGACRRTERAHPAIYAHDQAIPSFRFLACTGATTRTVIDRQSGGLTPATTLVTVTVGGNDLGFVDVMTTCTLNGDRTCVNRVERAINVIRTTLPARLEATYTTIRQKAPHAKIVIVGYPRLFTNTRDCDVLSPRKRAALNSAADLLSSVTEGRARAMGLVYVDVRDMFAGHGVCAADPWINALVSPTINSYHPNRAGQLAYVKALTEV